MKTTCPHCGKGFDVAIKIVLGWVERTPRLRDAVSSLIGRINSSKAGPIDPAKQVRSREACQKAAGVRWAGHIAKRPAIKATEPE